MTENASYAVVGAGIIGAAVARQLSLSRPGARVTIFEKEPRPAAHQTGHNSGVVHAGLYYEPGGLKARLCRRGVGLLREFCQDRHVPYEECGKLVIALDAPEEARLRIIFERATANGVPGVRLVGPEGIREVEPHAVGRLALHASPPSCRSSASTGCWSPRYGTWWGADLPRAGPRAPVPGRAPDQADRR